VLRTLRALVLPQLQQGMGDMEESPSTMRLRIIYYSVPVRDPRGASLPPPAPFLPRLASLSAGGGALRARCMHMR